MRLATYNVLCDIWDGHLHFPIIRFKKQMKMLQELEADILALQEVTFTYYSMLKNEYWTRFYYMAFDPRILDPNGVEKEIMGNVVLSKYPITQTTILPWFHERLDRPSVVTHIKFPHATLGLINTHLKASEDQSSQMLRSAQLKYLFDFVDKNMQTLDEVIILGDFNLHSDAENSYIRNDFYDCWPMKQTNSGFTMTTETNGLLQYMYPKEKFQYRLDRIIWRKKSSAEHKIWLESIALFANEKMFQDESDPTIPNEKFSNACASDHYGIVASFI